MLNKNYYHYESLVSICQGAAAIFIKPLQHRHGKRCFDKAGEKNTLSYSRNRQKLFAVAFILNDEPSRSPSGQARPALKTQKKAG